MLISKKNFIFFIYLGQKSAIPLSAPMTPELPFEILSNIATFLSLKENITCSYVCKLWKEPFQVAAWSDIKIYNSGTFHYITNPRTEEKTVYQINGKYVKSLLLYRTIRTLPVHFKAIQHAFPNVQHLNVGYVFLRKCKYGMESDWGNWRFLSTLIVELDDFLLDPPKGFFDMFSFLPALRKLEFVEITPKILKLKIQDLEALYMHAPLLKYIHLVGILLTLGNQDLKIISNICPAKNVTVLTINCLCNDKRWIYYFAKKYPNLRKFVFSIQESSSLPMFPDDKASLLLNRLSRPFVHLEELSLKVSEFPDDSHLTLWNLFSSFEIPVKRLAYSPRFRTGYSDTIVGRAIDASANAFSKTVRELRIVYHATQQIPRYLNTALYNCTHLVKLYISAFRIEINLDKLLDGCKALDQALFSETDICISPDAPNTFTPHNLTKISFVRSNVTADTLNHISPRCRKLRVLCLSETMINGSVSETTGRLSIDMSYSHLKYFHLKDSQIHPLSDNQPLNELISIIAIHKPVNQNLNVETQSSVESSNITWIHLYCAKNASNDWISKSRVLGKKESKRVRKYYSNFQMRKGTERETNQNTIRAWNGQTIKRKWRKDLCRGYAEIRIGEIDEHYMEQDTWCKHDRDFYQALLD
ncbi:hypothetical protein CLU79DRAFT_767062 [Phycomyces nitens]|nr:hypothetical protein CLU79DRAFT_767062 [Phycomyces nitens]